MTPQSEPDAVAWEVTVLLTSYTHDEFKPVNTPAKRDPMTSLDDNTYATELARYNKRLMEYEEEIVSLRGQVDLLKTEAIHDPATSLYSRSYFLSRLNEEIRRSERYRHFLSLILFHVDMPSQNSTHEIQRALKRISQELMLGLTRGTDILALYSKRQMVILLPETDDPGAQRLFERYQSAFPDNGRRMSYGVLTYPNDASNIEMIINRLQALSEDLFRGSSPAKSRGHFDD